MQKLLILAGALAVSTTAVAAGPDLETAIGKVDQDSIDDYRVYDDHTVYAHTKYGEWFMVQLAAPCASMTAKANVDFIPNSHGEFDKASSVRIKSEKCAAKSVMKSGEPPARPKAPPATPAP